MNSKPKSMPKTLAWINGNILFAEIQLNNNELEIEKLALLSADIRIKLQHLYNERSKMEQKAKGK